MSDERKYEHQILPKTTIARLILNIDGGEKHRRGIFRWSIHSCVIAYNNFKLVRFPSSEGMLPVIPMHELKSLKMQIKMNTRMVLYSFRTLLFKINGPSSNMHQISGDAPHSIKTNGSTSEPQEQNIGWQRTRKSRKWALLNDGSDCPNARQTGDMTCARTKVNCKL